jgi:hypothetical protein
MLARHHARIGTVPEGLPRSIYVTISLIPAITRGTPTGFQMSSLCSQFYGY